MSGPFFVSASTALAAFRSFLTYVAIVVYIAVIGPPTLLIAWVFGWKRGLYLAGHGGVGLALLLTGIRYRVVGRENVPPGAVVYCSNHESNVDPGVLFQCLHPMMHILYKQELHRIPLMGMAFDLGGFVAVDRADRRKSIASVDRAVESLQRGNSFLIFPEGTRSRTGELLPFKKGGFIMAIKAQAPIVPVAVQGGRAAMQRGSKLIRPVKVSIRIGEPIETAGHTLEERDELIAIIRERIGALLAMGPV
jgi:1-acyl-sn-glycerol-3-phosphate acyltransferase